ncbi:MAG: glycosyltransferase [Oscillospiraceae bacterium]|jgi:glycosyltransferase involved in cell wall biosynthesis|nr:glycosyltransferase [Oscillospiraceae bacterium]
MKSTAQRISVLLAAYCGEHYLEAQLDSILPQLGADDELLISDDSPPEHRATWAIARRYAEGDARVRVLEGPRGGVVKNVAFLLGRAQGALLVLCDQDDVWLPDKLKRLRECFADETVLLVVHDARVADEALRVQAHSFFAAHGSKPGLLQNLCRNSFIGCCMALRAELIPVALPFPKNLPMHDQWLGLLAQRHGQVLWLDEPLILYRRHEGALTGQKTGLAQKLLWRLQIGTALLLRSKNSTRRRNE